MVSRCKFFAHIYRVAEANIDFRKNILLFSTIAAKMGIPFHASTAACKAAVEGLTKSLAAELSPNIRVNCIAPGFIKTPMTDKLTEDQQNQILKNIPASRFGLPSDVASACIYLSSDEASFITGSTLHVNGGMAMI